MPTDLARWRDRIKSRIRQEYPPGLQYDAEVERRLKAIEDFPVPTDEELIGMQERGELASDEDLARHSDATPATVLSAGNNGADGTFYFGTK